jgi:LysM repeat protein
MALKKLLILWVVVAIVSTGCLKQASPPAEVIAEAQSDTGLIPFDAPTNTPNPDEITVIIHTSVPPLTEDEEAQSPTEQPADEDITSDEEELFTSSAEAIEDETLIPSATPFVEVEATNTSSATATDMPEIVMLTATPFPTGTPQSMVDPVTMVTSTPFVQQPVITPGSPLSEQSALVTPTPPPAESQDDGILEGATATPSGLVTPTDAFFPESPINEDCLYVVRGGDTLFRIALNNNTTVAAIQQVNPNLNPNIIRPGQEIILPDCDSTATPPASVGQPTAPAGDSGPAGVETTHIVQSGDTLGAIARRYGVTIPAIVSRNNLTNPDRLSIGQELIIPAPGG